MLGTNLNQWAVIRLIKEKKILAKEYNNKYIDLAKLKNERVEILKTQSGIINSLTGLSKLLKMDESKIAFIFLIFIAIILEMMVFGSVTFTGKLFNKINFRDHGPDKKKTPNMDKKKNTKIEKQQKEGQRFFFEHAA